MLKEVKSNLIKEFGISANDTGSCQVQIALITERIRQISQHLVAAPKDNHSRLGLLKLVGRRKTYLKYLKKNSLSSYEALMTKLGK